MDLNFKIERQNLSRTDNQNVVNLSDNYLRLCFTFKTDDWNNLYKFILVKHDGEATRVPVTNDKVTLPVGLLKTDKLVFTLYGVDNVEEETIRITTNPQRITLLDSGYVDEYSEILDIITQHDIDEIYALIDTKANAGDVAVALAGKSDVGHLHDDRYYTEHETDNLLAGKSNTGHVHDDRYYTESETDTLLDTKSNTGHTHDDRYYTESEIDNQLNGKVDKVNGKGLSTNDYTTAEKNKLAGIETGANKTIVDNAISSSSTNPLQNKVIYNLLAEKVDKITGKGLSTNDFTNAYKDVLDTFDGDWDEVIQDHLDEIVAGVIEQLTAGEFYTKSQVDALIAEAITDLDNRIAITSNPSVIQSGDVADISVQLIQDGVPLSNRDIYFFEKLEPSLTLTSNKSIIQTGDVADFTAKLKDSDGSLVQDTDVYFFVEDDEVVENSNTENNENMEEI